MAKPLTSLIMVSLIIEVSDLPLSAHITSRARLLRSGETVDLGIMRAMKNH
jgi:hypothetical protein